MKIQYRKLWLFMIGVAFLLTLLVLMAVAFITEDLISQPPFSADFETFCSLAPRGKCRLSNEEVTQ